MSDNMTVGSQAKLKSVFIGRQWFLTIIQQIEALKVLFLEHILFGVKQITNWYI